LKVGDLVQRRSKAHPALAMIVDFKSVYEDCGNNYPIIMWLDSNEFDSCHHTRLEIVNEC